MGCDGTVCVIVTSRLTGHITLTCTSLPVYKCMHFTRSVMLQQRCVVYIKHRTNYRMKFDEKRGFKQHKTGSGTPDETFTVTAYNLAGVYQSKDFLSSYKNFKKSIYWGLGKRILHGDWNLVITTRRHPVPKLLTPKCCHIHMQTLVYRE